MQALWYEQNLWYKALLPASWVFSLLVFVRKKAYQKGILPQRPMTVPVIVVGNITVGGTGKTPLVQAITTYLLKQNIRPGIVSRGYGGKEVHRLPTLVTKISNPDIVGDEPVLLAQIGVPVVVAKSRNQAIEHLLKNFPETDVIISDDGLQHYAMKRAIEIAVIDGQRRLGNQQLLPAGPLREPPARLKEVDFVVTNEQPEKLEKSEPLEKQKNPENPESSENLKNPGKLEKKEKKEFSMQLIPQQVVCQVNNPKNEKPLSDFLDKKVHALAGIGNPKRFFDLLKILNIEHTAHAFPDHHRFVSKEICFSDDLPILMTQKDAIKCQRIASDNTWYLKVEATLPSDFLTQLHHRLQRLQDGQKTT